MQQSDAMSIFTDNVKHHMRQAGWTQQDMADASGMQRAQLSKMLAGRHDPRCRQMERIADALGLPLFTLLTPIPSRAAK